MLNLLLFLVFFLHFVSPDLFEINFITDLVISLDITILIYDFILFLFDLFGRDVHPFGISPVAVVVWQMDLSGLDLGHMGRSLRVRHGTLALYDSQTWFQRHDGRLTLRGHYDVFFRLRLQPLRGRVLDRYVRLVSLGAVLPRVCHRSLYIAEEI